MSFLRDRFSFKENKRRLLNIRGIVNGAAAFKGPDVVQIDLTDKCRSHCIACWLHSPLHAKQASADFKDLDFTAAESLIKDAALYGAKEIIISGGGEPFLHPRIWDVLELIEKMGLCFRINTSLNECGRNDINRIASFKKMASITVSIWAANGDLYARLHGRSKEDFQKTKENLAVFNSLKSPGTCSSLFCLITNLNYKSTREMRELASVTKSDGIEFGLPDIMPGVTDSLLLNRGQLDVLYDDFSRLCREKKHKARIINKDVFAARILNPGAEKGEYDSPAAVTRCFAGWVFLRVRANGDYNSCLKSHRMPIGNAYNESIYSVWNNALQQRFRRQSLKVPKDAGYFSYIGNAPETDTGCKRACDNILVNRGFYRFTRPCFGLCAGNCYEKN
ncbi:MAG: radical SAM protein [Candidatus Omnitrophica bacterium]|nr:radical SAM protein [Candidatus Omnitrophota bacterium]